VVDVKIPALEGTLDWDYDEETDVLYLSVGAPRPATGADVGEGMIVRYDEESGEFLGLTVTHLMARVRDALARG